MSFLINWWLGYRRRQHRHHLIMFVAAGLVCSVVLLVGAYLVLHRQSPPPDVAELPSGMSARGGMREPKAGVAPDFAAILPKGAAAAGYSVVRLPDDRQTAYAVGFRGERGTEVAVVRDSLVGYRLTARLELPAAAGTGPEVFPTVRLWPSAGQGIRLVAVVPQAPGWNAAYVVTLNGDDLKLVERATPLSDTPPQYLLVGQNSSLRRTAWFGDLNGDGLPNEISVEVTAAGRPVSHEAYELKDGRLDWQADLAEAATQSVRLFREPRTDISEMLVIDATEPTVMEFSR